MNYSDFEPIESQAVNKLPSVYAKFDALLIAVRIPEPGMNKPVKLTVRLLQNAEIPFAKKNTDPKDMVIPPPMVLDKENGNVNIYGFRIRTDLYPGNVYELKGVTYGSSKEPKESENGKKYDTPFVPLNVRIVNDTNLSIKEVIHQLSFEEKMITKECFDKDLLQKESNDIPSFFVDVNWKMDEIPKQPGTIVGAFKLPDRMDTVVFQYEKQGKIFEDSFGGTNKGLFTMLVNQYDQFSNKTSFFLQSRLYKSQVALMQSSDWQKLGLYYMRRQKGWLICNVNRSDTGQCEVTPAFVGRVKAFIRGECSFIPDLPEMVQEAGLELSWENLLKFHPGFESAKNIVAKSDPINYKGMRCVNLMRVSGDISAMAKYPHLIKFYVIMSYDSKEKFMDDFEAARKLPETERLLWMTDKKNWDAKTIVYDIFAICSPECKEPISAFICPPGLLAEIETTDHKRVKTSDEETVVVEDQESDDQFVGNAQYN